MDPEPSEFDMLKGAKNFVELTVDDALVIEKEGLVTLKDSDLLFNALKVLSQKRVLGAPVVAESDGGGFLDLLDAASYVATKKIQKDTLGTVNVPCREIMRDHHDIVFVKRSTLITEAITHMVIHRVHRLAVLEDDDTGPTKLPIAFSRLYSMITQSDLFSIMVSYTYSFQSGSSFDKKISDLNFEIPKLCVCSTKDQTSEAFATMKQHGFSSLGVVDGAGKLVNYLGATHLKNLTMATLLDLHLTVEEFLKTRQPQFTTFTVATTLKEVISAAKDAHFHRVFFVDDQQKPAGVLTLRDFLEVMVMKLKLFS